MTRGSQRSNARESLFRNLPKLLGMQDFAGCRTGACGFVFAVVILIWDNLTYNLRQLGIRLGFDFLKSQASFDIGESLIAYNPANSFARAMFC